MKKVARSTFFGPLQDEELIGQEEPSPLFDVPVIWPDTPEPFGLAGLANYPQDLKTKILNTKAEPMAVIDVNYEILGPVEGK